MLWSHELGSSRKPGVQERATLRTSRFGKSGWKLGKGQEADLIDDALRAVDLGNVSTSTQSTKASRQITIRELAPG